MPVANRPARIGKYEITDVIGEGGMGAVYKATDPRIGRTVAIKVIKGDFSENPELLKRFYREAQAVGNLQHPNIVIVYDLGEEHGNPYLVMEYLNGIPLDKIIAQRQSVPLVQKLGIVIEVLNALHYAHQHNVVHRDVKPANVMLLRDGHVKLLDFGIAREGDLGQTKTGQVMGTMWYMSPEQLNSETVDGRGDVYSAGIMFYELLAYTLPFDPRDMTGMIVKRLRGDPAPPLSKYLESYPPELDEIIARALAVNREHRFSTAEEFAFELSRLQERLKRDMVSHFVDKARESIARSDLTKARELLSQVLQVDTQNPTAKQLLYEIQQTLQRTARSEKVKQIRAEAAGALSARQLEQAANLIQEAIKLDSTDPDLLDLRQQIEQAKSRGQQVKKLLTLAKVAQQTGELVVAKKAVEDALALDPQDTDAKLIQSSIARQLIEYEKQRQIQQFLEAARREIAAHQLAAAQENVAKAKAIDPAYPEIPGLEQMLKAGLEQEARQRDLAQLFGQIEQELSANRPKAARDIAANAMRKFHGEPNLMRLKTAAEAAIEKEERRAYVDERMATASRLIEGGEATRALRMLKDVEREYPTDLRLREYLEVVRQAAARENAAREKEQLLQQARAAMRSKSFTQAISVLEGSLVQFPEDAEIKDLLKAAREEFERLSRKKQVEEVSKQAQDLLHSRAHTDAIRLLERTVAQVSDPELTNLLQYARQEAAKFRAGVREAGEQATQMLNLGHHSEAVTFLEAQVDKYGKNADFQVLLEQARKQAEDTRRAKERLQSSLKDARAKLRAQDIHGAEALLRVCELEAADEPDVLALAIEIEEEKKAGERRRTEAAERAAREKQEAERRQAEEAQRALLIKQDEERRQREAAERELRRQREAAEAADLAQKKAAAERREREAAERELQRQREAAEAADLAQKKAAAERREREAAERELQRQREAAAAAELAEKKALAERREREAAERELTRQREAAAAGPSFDGAPATVRDAAGTSGGSPTPVLPPEGPPTIAPLAPVEEVARLRMETVVEEPKPAEPSRPPEPPAPFLGVPPEVQPSSSKRPIFIAAGGLAIVVLAVVVWFLAHNPTPTKVVETQPSVASKAGAGETSHAVQPTKALVKIIAPPRAKFTLGEVSKTVDADGTAEVETKPGTYSLEMDAPDYKHYSGSVTLELGNNEPLIVSPEPLHGKLGTLIVKANVDHFDVLIDGKLKSNSGKGQQVEIKNLPEGSHKVTIKKSDYEEPKYQSVTIAANSQQSALFNLIPKAPTDATLSVTMQPAGKIRIDDGSPVNLPDGSYSGKLSPGSHKVEASADGYQPQTKSVTAKAGDTLSLPFELQPIPIAAKPEPTIKASAEPPDIEQGKSATIRWNTQNATQVILDGKPFEANGQIDVTPDKDTTYTLIAKGPGEDKTEHVKISVHAKPVIAEKPTTVDEKPAIMAAKERWRLAYESLDKGQLEAAWPNIPPQVERKILDLANARVRLSVEYDDCTSPKISGDGAETSCKESVAVIGGRPPRPRHVVMEFAKHGDKWVLSNLTGSN